MFASSPHVGAPACRRVEVTRRCDLRAFRCQARLTGLVVAGWAGVLLWGPGGDAPRVISNLGLPMAAGLAALSCVDAARRRPESRRTWALFGAAAGSWTLGQVLWSWYEEVVGRELPFPSPADVGYLAMVPLAVLALLTVPGAPRDGAARVRAVAEGLVIGASMLLLSWTLVLEPMSSQAMSLLEGAISFAYPLGDVALATIALSVLSRVRRDARLPMVTLGLLCAALVALAASDSLFAYLYATGGYASGHLADTGWFCGFLLMALAARRPVLAGAERDGDPATQPAPAGAVTPFLAVVVLVVALAVHHLVRGAEAPVALWGLRGTMLLLATAQFLANRENLALARTLERRVATRTAELADSEERFRSLVQHSTDVVAIVDEEGVVVYESPSLLPVFGYEPEALVGTRVLDLLPPRERERAVALIDRITAAPGTTEAFEVELLHRDGTWRTTETTVTNLLHVPTVAGLVLNTRDVSERRQLEDALTHQAYHDTLTGLPNRARLQERLDAALARIDDHRGVALLFVDLDGFKMVNDSLGHAAGDAVLVEVARRLSACVRPEDTVARLGGDEFAVLLDEVVAEAEPTAVAERIAAVLREPVTVGDQHVFAAASVGVALGRPGVDTGDRLLGDADAAMYRAKASGLGSYERFEPTMRSTTPDRVALEADLRRAIDEEELRLHYQPTVDLTTGRVVGVEALVRWQHPTRGLLSPADFVPVAERSALVVRLGRWVLREACRQAAAWRRQLPGGHDLFVAVNLSGRHVSHPDVALDVAEALAAAGLPADRLVLEMTESVLVERTDETLATLGQLRDLGVRLAIDDFGTGWSSLSYLHRFPLDVLKIDRTFVDRLSREHGPDGLASAIVRIGDALGLETVAEGVEEPAQLSALQAMGCRLAQGYLLGRPMPPEALAAVLGDTGHRVVDLLATRPAAVPGGGAPVEFSLIDNGSWAATGLALSI